MMATEMEKSKLRPEAHKDGSKGWADAYIIGLLPPVGRIVWKDKVWPGGYTYGILSSPATMKSNESESGEDVAMFMCEVKRDRHGKITRRGRHRGKGYWYPQFTIPYECVCDVANALLELVGGEIVSDMKAGTEIAPPDAEEMRIQEAWRKLGML